MISAGGLLAELEAHSPADARERDSLEQIRALLHTAADPFTRALTEHVTGSAVVARPGGDSFLLVHHRRLDRWLQPGGHVEAEDACLFEAARREAKEETGVEDLEAPFGPRIVNVDVHAIPPRGDRPAHVHFDVCYLLTTRAETLAAQEAEVLRAAWFRWEEVAASGADASLIRALRTARSLLAGQV